MASSFFLPDIIRSNERVSPDFKIAASDMDFKQLFGLMTQFANSAIQGVSDSIVALIPVITLTTVIGIAIRMFKKYVKA